jgi:hypothetical protein
MLSRDIAYGAKIGHAHFPVFGGFSARDTESAIGGAAFRTMEMGCFYWMKAAIDGHSLPLMG